MHRTVVSKACLWEVDEPDVDKKRTKVSKVELFGELRTEA